MQSPRSETAGQKWPSAQHVLQRGCVMFSLSLYSGAVFSPRRCPWPPWGTHQAFPWGVALSLLHLQPSTPEITFPGRSWHFSPFHTLYPVLRPGASEEEAAAERGCVWPVPGPGLNVSRALPRTKSSTSFWLSLFYGGSRWCPCSHACAQTEPVS